MRYAILLVLLSTTAQANDYRFYEPMPPSEFQRNFDTMRRAQEDQSLEYQRAETAREISRSVSDSLNRRDQIDRDVIDMIKRGAR